MDRPIGEDTSFGEQLFNKVPGVREVQQLTNPNRSWGDKLLTGRLGAGLPIRNLTENQQLFAEQEWKDRMIDNPLKEINTSQYLFSVTTRVSSDQKADIFVVNNKAVLDQYGNPTTVASFYTPQEAIQYVKRHLPDNYKKVPKTWDVDNQGNPYQRPVGN